MPDGMGKEGLRERLGPISDDELDRIEKRYRFFHDAIEALRKAASSEEPLFPEEFE